MRLTKREIIILDCVFCWVMDNDDQQVKLIEASRMMDINDLKGEVVFLSHAPTLSELMDKVVTEYPACAFEMLWSDDEWEIDLANDLPQICQGDNGPSHLLTLFNVLMEVTP
jgi:hypothetical protein